MINDVVLVKLAGLAIGVAGFLMLALPVLLLVWLMWFFAVMRRETGEEPQQRFRRISTITFGDGFAVCGLMAFALNHSRTVLNY